MIDRNHVQLWLIHGNKFLMDDLIQPEDVAELAAFLVSDDAYSIDAFDMVVDGCMINHRDKPTHSWFDAEGQDYYH